MKGIEQAKFNLLNFASWEFFSWFLLSADFFYRVFFLEVYTIGVSIYSLDRQFVGPDLSPNCL